MRTGGRGTITATPGGAAVIVPAAPALLPCAAGMAPLQAPAATAPASPDPSMETASDGSDNVVILPLEAQTPQAAPAASQNPFRPLESYTGPLQPAAQSRVAAELSAIHRAANYQHYEHLQDTDAIQAAFDREVKGRLDALASRAETDADCRTRRVLRTFLATSITPFEHIPPLDPHERREKEALDHLEQLLGCGQDGAITTLDAGEVARLYRVIRSAAGGWLDRTFFSLIAEAQSADHLRRIIAFVEDFGRLPAGYGQMFRDAFITPQKAGAVSLQTIDHLIGDFLRRAHSSAVQQRLAAFAASDDELAQIASPILERALPDAPEDLVPASVLAAVDAIERHQHSSGGEKNGRSKRLSEDLAALGIRTDRNTLTSTSLSRLLMKEDNFSAIVTARILREEDNPDADVRQGVVKLIGILIERGMDDGDAAQQLSRLDRMWQAAPQKAAEAIISVAAALARTHPDIPAWPIFFAARVLTAFEQPLKVDSSLNDHLPEIFTIADALWPELPATEKKRAFDLATKQLEAFGSDRFNAGEKLVPLIVFLSHHVSELPQRIAALLATKVDFAEAFASARRKILPPESAQDRGTALDIAAALHFALASLDEPTRVLLKTRVQRGLDPEGHPIPYREGLFHIGEIERMMREHAMSQDEALVLAPRLVSMGFYSGAELEQMRALTSLLNSFSALGIAIVGDNHSNRLFTPHWWLQVFYSNEALAATLMKQMLRESDNPHPLVRKGVVSAIEALLDRGASAADAERYLAILEGLFREDSPDIADHALHAIAKLARVRPATPGLHQFFVSELLEKPDVLRKQDDHPHHRSTDPLAIAHAVWPQLTPSQKAGVFGFIRGKMLPDWAGDAFLIPAMHLLSRHSAEVPRDIAAFIAGSNRGVWRLAARAGHGDNADEISAAHAAIPFAIASLGASARAALTKQLVEDLDQPTPSLQETQRRQTFILAPACLSLGLFDEGQRMQAIRSVVERHIADPLGSAALASMMQAADPREAAAARAAISAAFRRHPSITEETTENRTDAVPRAILKTFLAIAPSRREWQTPEALEIFEDAVGPTLTAHLREISAKIPPRQMPALFEVLAKAFVTGENAHARPLIAHLIEATRDAGTFQQVMPFLRDFGRLPQVLQEKFIEAIADDSRRTIAGKRTAAPEGTTAGQSDGAPTTGDTPLQLAPAKAHTRLKRFLLDRFLEGLGGTAREQSALRVDIQRRPALWQEGDLMPNLTSLSSFSGDEGKASIRQLALALASEASVEATARAGNRRFVFPGRFDSLQGTFSPTFIERWGAGGADRVFPLGRVDTAAILASDPQALTRTKYEYAGRQMAGHLGIPGFSHLAGRELFEALVRHAEAIEDDGFPATGELKGQLAALAQKMQRLEAIEETEVELLLRGMRAHPRIESALGPYASEVMADLSAFKRSLSAAALGGTFWLVVTSSPADFIGSGRSPVTCQDPTRKTGHNGAGQPANRALGGRFLYAKAIMADDVRVENGIAVASPDAVVVNRAHLEATTETGKPDPGAAPHLLIEKSYPHPGFIHAQGFANALDRFASESLGLDPKTEVHNAATGKNMSNHPPHLPDDRPVYRDTFR